MFVGTRQFCTWSVEFDESCVRIVRTHSRTSVFFSFQTLTESTDANVVIRAVVALVTIYCILTNCTTAIVSLKSFSADKLYPNFSYFSSKLAQQAGAYVLVATVGLIFVTSGKRQPSVRVSEANGII